MGVDHPGLCGIRNPISLADQPSCINHVFIKNRLFYKASQFLIHLFLYAAHTLEQKKVLIPYTGRSFFVFTEDSSG